MGKVFQQEGERYYNIGTEVSLKPFKLKLEDAN